MDILKTAFTMASNAAQNYYNTYTKQQKLRQQLKVCTYTDDVKLMIQKAVKQVFNVYTNFTTQLLEFSQKGQLKRYLELKSQLDIQIRGKVCKVDYNMMLPVNYPKKPPYVRIVNKDPSHIVNNFYLSLRSPTDPNSFILNEKMVQCKNWDQTKSIVNIIIESHNMLRQNFPFNKPSQNQEWNQYGNQGFNQYGGNQNSNYGFVNLNNNNMANKPRAPIPFSTTNVNQSIANGQQFVGTSKKIIEKLKSQHMKSVQKIQFLETVKFSLESQEQYLRHENLKMNNFLRNSQKSTIKDIGSLIRVRDERSQQILDLTSSIRAKQDCLTVLEAKYNEGEINFEEMMKFARKLQEQKFEEKFLLAKCIQKAR